MASGWDAECGSLGRNLVGLLMMQNKNQNAMFTFHLYLKILLRFLLVSENEYWHRSFVKATWYKVNFWKEGDSCRLNSSHKSWWGLTCGFKFSVAIFPLFTFAKIWNCSFSMWSIGGRMGVICNLPLEFPEFLWKNLLLDFAPWRSLGLFCLLSFSTKLWKLVGTHLVWQMLSG